MEPVKLTKGKERERELHQGFAEFFRKGLAVTVLGFLGHAVSATTLLWQPGSSREHTWPWLCSSNTSQQRVLGLIQSVGLHLPAPDLGGPQASRGLKVTL